MFIGQLFKQNINLGPLESLDVISRVQEHLVIRNPMIISKKQIYPQFLEERDSRHVYSPIFSDLGQFLRFGSIFQGKSEFCSLVRN